MPSASIDFPQLNTLPGQLKTMSHTLYSMCDSTPSPMANYEGICATSCSLLGCRSTSEFIARANLMTRISCDMIRRKRCVFQECRQHGGSKIISLLRNMRANCDISSRVCTNNTHKQVQMLALRRGPRLAGHPRSHVPTSGRFSSSQAPRSALKTGLYATAFLLSTGLFAVYYLDARSALHRYILTPLLRHTLDAETGHKFAVKVLKSGLGPRDPCPDDKRLKSQVWGQELSNPVGLAAGFDKDGEAIDGLFNLGFSWVEIGSVTPKPQPGNPRPRVFHLPEDSGLINRYGFPSQGHTSVLSRLRARIPAFQPEHATAALRQDSVLAVNLGKNKESPVDSIEDFVAGVHAFGPYSDVLVVNVSSPNTPGLRGLQSRDLLEKLLDGVTEARDHVPVSQLTLRRPKLVLKLSPDLDETQIRDIAEVIKKSSIDGVIVSNTTTQRPKYLTAPNKDEVGGLSGAPVKKYSLNALRALRSHLPSSIPLIGCGGIFTGADALEYGKAGASLVQVYTGFGYDGVGACRRIKDELAKELQREGTTWAEVVKKAVDELSFKEDLKEPNRSEVGGEGTISQLILEARELQGLLDKLDEKIGGRS